MPELPEVEVIVRGLRKNIIGLKILEFKIINKHLRLRHQKKWSFFIKIKLSSIFLE